MSIKENFIKFFGKTDPGKKMSLQRQIFERKKEKEMKESVKGEKDMKINIYLGMNYLNYSKCYRLKDCQGETLQLIYMVQQG